MLIECNSANYCGLSNSFYLRIRRDIMLCLRCVSLLAVLFVGTTQSAQALEMFTTDGSAGIRTDAGFTIGNEFTVGNQNIVVTGLGIWDGMASGDGSDGLNFSHQVGIWNAADTLLTSVTVPAGTLGTLINEVRYTSVGSPIVLQKNQTYWMGGLFAAGTSDAFRNNSNTPTLSTDFTVSNARYNVNPTTLLRPTGPAGAGIYFGPNLQYTVPVAELTSTPTNGSNIGLSYESTGLSITFEDVITLQNTGEFGSAIDITGYSFSGPDAGLFDVVSFAPITLTAGISDQIIYDLDLDLSTLTDPYSAVLTFMTSAGNISFNLTANFVPEPNSLALAGCGLVSLVVRRRRNR